MAINKAKNRPLLAKRSRGDVGLLEITEALEHYAVHGDWSRLGVLMQTVGSRDSSIIRAIVERCLAGAKFKRSPGSTFGWKLKVSPEIGRSVTPKLIMCKKLAAEGVSFRSQRLAELLSIPHDEVEDEYDINRALKGIIRRAERAGKSQEILTELEACRLRIFRLDL